MVQGHTQGSQTYSHHSGLEVAGGPAPRLTCDVLLSRSLILSFTSFISEVIL